MRAFPVAVRGLALVLVAAVFSAPPVQADDPTVAQLQSELADARADLNRWYAKSAAAAERLNGAKFDEEMATEALQHSLAVAKRAERQRNLQRDAVAALTVDQLQSASTVSQLTALMDSDGPQQLLSRTSAYAITQDAMTATLDDLAARQVVFDAAARQADEARQAGLNAQKRQRDAKAAIDAAVRQAEKVVVKAQNRRDRLVEAMAVDRGISLDEAAALQDEAETGGAQQPGDTASPSEPDSPDPSTPAPTTPAPTTPSPTEPPPAPPASSSKVETAIAFAKAQLGEKYEWGGAGPSKWDCSGLTMRAWQAAGVSMAHYAGAQYSSTRHVSVSSIKRGDLLYWSDGSASSIYHVAIYLGGGQMIHAPRPGRTVEIVPLTYWIKPDLASRPG